MAPVLIDWQQSTATTATNLPQKVRRKSCDSKGQRTWKIAIHESPTCFHVGKKEPLDDVLGHCTGHGDAELPAVVDEKRFLFHILCTVTAGWLVVFVVEGGGEKSCVKQEPEGGTMLHNATRASGRHT